MIDIGTRELNAHHVAGSGVVHSSTRVDSAEQRQEDIVGTIRHEDPGSIVSGFQFPKVCCRLRETYRLSLTSTIRSTCLLHTVLPTAVTRSCFSDYNYNGYYINSDDSHDPRKARGYNYHNGPVSPVCSKFELGVKDLNAEKMSKHPDISVSRAIAVVQVSVQVYDESPLLSAKQK